MAKGILLPAVWVLGALFGSQAQATSLTIVGVIHSIDVRGRIVSLRGGMRFTAARGVKLSSRQPGEEVTVVYRAADNGLVALEVRPAPVAQHSFITVEEQQLRETR